MGEDTIERERRYPGRRDLDAIEAVRQLLYGPNVAPPAADADKRPSGPVAQGVFPAVTTPQRQRRRG